MYQDKKWFTDIIKTLNQVNESETKQCKHECKCNTNKTDNKDFMTTLKSIYNQVNSDYYDMEMLADFIIDCEEMIKNPKKQVKVTFIINRLFKVIKDDTYQDIANQIKQIVETYPEQEIYTLECNNNYIRSNNIEMIYDILNSLDNKA